MRFLVRLTSKFRRDLLANSPLVTASRRCGFHSTGPLSINSSQNESKTVDANEIQLFNNLSDKWWHENGEFKALHALNKLRVPFIRDGLINSGKISINTATSGTPLTGMKIIDIGCGGGILSEPLARLGADIVGLDASQESISSAQVHASRMTNPPQYVCETIEDHAKSHSNVYDAVVLSEVLEHIQSKDVCLQLCCSMLKARGSIFITTINQTVLSWLLVIVAAERLIQFIPPDTHHWDKFITPIELQNKLRNSGCSTRLIHGMRYDILCNRWHWTTDTSVNYAIHAVKQSDETIESMNSDK
ncbi:hypothetical protein J437_LFUL002067 [Ladona fulva]|uniref:Ubiquinone biosynthesis O-methyltransferase, mitochondrial n=1 Tax=Ladona fulva TaxID=123851 RepID=A0A8K0K0C1_LADFU|nr:hypothetical protein J437_LFUL002067 [Ladona fulva]